MLVNFRGSKASSLVEYENDICTLNYDFLNRSVD